MNDTGRYFPSGDKFGTPCLELVSDLQKLIRRIRRYPRANVLPVRVCVRFLEGKYRVHPISHKAEAVPKPVLLPPLRETQANPPARGSDTSVVI